MTPGTLTQAVHALADVEEAVTLVDHTGAESVHTWASLYRQGQRVAGGLSALGVRTGDRVGLMFDTSPDLIASLLGCWALGAVPTPVYPPLRLGRLEEWTERTAHLLDKTDARVLLTAARMLPWMGEMVARAQLPLGARTVSQLPHGEAPAVDVSADALGLVQFSSGTTGTPKAVMLTQRALMAQVEALAAPMLRAFPDYRYVGSGCGWLPLYHDMGLIGLFLTPLLFQRPVVLMSPQRFVTRPVSWLEALSAHRATISVAPNFAYGLCADRIEPRQLADLDLSAWRVALNGAEPIAPETMRRFYRKLADTGLRPEALTPVYGLSEAALAVTFSSVEARWTSTRFDRVALARDEVRACPEDPRGLEVVSCGRPLPGCAVEVRVGDRVVEDQVGRLFVRSPSLMRGYLAEPERSADALRDGWLDTGDRAFVHQGELYLLGRDRDVLILRGQNHDPTPLERAVDQVEGVRVGCAAAVSFRPEAHDTEVLVVFVEHAQSATAATTEDLGERCARQIAADTGLQPDLVEVLEPGTLPRTSSGKIRRSEASRRFQAGLLTPPNALTRRYLAARAVASGVGWVRRWRR